MFKKVKNFVSYLVKWMSKADAYESMAYQVVSKNKR